MAGGPSFMSFILTLKVILNNCIVAGMDICPDLQPDLAQLLPREAFHEILWMLRRSLPAPLTDDPAEVERRDRSAMATVASLLPVTAAEGRLAAQFASADAWARDCQLLAAERRLEPGLASPLP